MSEIDGGWKQFECVELKQRRGLRNQYSRLVTQLNSMYINDTKVYYSLGGQLWTLMLAMARGVF